MTLNHQFNKNDAVADAVSPVGRAGPARRAVLRPFRAAERASSSQLVSRSPLFTSRATAPADGPGTASGSATNREQARGYNRSFPLSASRSSAPRSSLLALPSSRRTSALARPLAGFTLIELLVVMLVIMILAGLMLKMGAYIRDSALQNQAQSEMNAIAGAISAYAADHGYARPPDPLYQALLMGPKKYLDWPAARILPGSSVGNSTGLLDPWGGLYSYKAGRGDTPGHDPSAGGGNMFKTGDMMLYLGTSGAPSGQNVGRWYSVIAGSNMGDTHHF